VSETPVKTATPGEERERVARRRDVLGALERAVKTALLYPPDSPQPAEFRARLLQSLGAFLDGGAPFVVSARDGELASGEAVLRGEGGGDESLAATLARDGVRRLAFLPGLDDEGLAAFLDAVRAAVAGRAAGEDLPTRLWLAAPKAVRWEVVGELDDAALEAREKGLRAGTGRGFGGGTTADYAALAAKGGGRPPELSGAAAPGAPAPLEAARIMNALADLSGEAEALEACRREAVEFEPEAAVAGIAVELLAGDDDAAEFARTCALVQGLYERFVERGRFGAALLLRRGLAARETEERAASPDRAARLADVRRAAAGEENVSRLAAALDAPGSDLDAGARLLADLPGAAVPPLLAALGRLSRYPARKTVCDALVEMGRERVGELAPGLSDHRWFVARNTAWVLGRIGGEHACSLLEGALAHREEAVRREAAAGLVRLETPESNRLLRRVLRDPSLELRLMALSVLGDRADAGSRATLARRVLAPDFRRLMEAEQEEWLDALARAGGDEALPAFRALAEPGLFRDWGARRRLALRAVAALSAASGSGTRDYLRTLAAGRDAGRRVEAERALARRQARGEAP
jgi:HEAT repeat protein